MLKKFVLLYLTFLSIEAIAQDSESSRKEIELAAAKAEQYLSESKFKESLVLSREALKSAIQIDDAYLIAKAYNTIAGNFYQLSENDKALKNYRRALYYAEKANNDTLKGRFNNNVANMYFFSKKDYLKSSYHYEKAISYAEKTKDTARLLVMHLNITWARFEIKDFKGGFPHLEFINKYGEKYGSPSVLVYVNMLNGLYYSQSDAGKAEQYFNNAIAIGLENKLDLDLSYSYEKYADFLYANGNYEKAYDYLSKHHEIVNELYDHDKLEKAGIEGVNLEIDEYKRALGKISEENQLQSLSIKKSQIIFGLFIGILLILVLLLYSLNRNFRYKKKSNLELLRANEDLNLAKNRAEEASLLKSQFVSTISHELRTPLYGVVGITNMISDEHKELANSPHLQSLKFSAKYLLSLVNDILQINKIEENKIKLESNIFNIADEIATVKNSLQFIALRNRNEVEMEVDPAIPEYLIGDKLRLAQILMNLVSNALKFTTNGNVSISAKLDRIDGNFHFIAFTVKDDGVGIAEADQAKIFEKFVQIERKEDDYQGTGLGLSIVQKLIELFRSNIELYSREGQGTSFSFTIGFEHDLQKSTEIINNIDVDLTSGQRFDVLVVEDNKINQIVTKKIMEKHNFNCTMADSGLEAIEILKKSSFDVILMDINMPVMNGFETTRRIRAMGLKTPIVALTAFDKDEVAEEALASGMNDVICKPFEPIKLFHIISAQISKQNAG